MKKIILTFITVLAFTSSQINAQQSVVSNINEYNQAIKMAKAGDVITLKNGNWRNVIINAYGKGEEGKNIVIKAETPGKVIISGNSTLNIYGEYVTVSGLWFKDGTTEHNSIVQFRKNSKISAYNCRFTNSTISYLKSKNNTKDNWVVIYGYNNRVDHNNFTGKTHLGATLVVDINGEDNAENNHSIDNNFFGPRPDLRKNGGETIRIGTSLNSMKTFKTLVERNVFSSCNGEIEIISNKSSGNIFRDNLFFESQGSLTLRHGNNSLVERNVFLGNKVDKTGGIRVVGEGHVIKNNLLIGLTGTSHRGSIVLMNGIVNSPLGRYHQVNNVDIQNNTLINSSPIFIGEGKDFEKHLTPKNVNFSNNLIYNEKSSKSLVFVDFSPGVSFNNNYIDAPGSSNNSFIATKINWKKIKDYLVPTLQNPDLLVTYKNNKSPQIDITNSARKNYNAGAFNLNQKLLPKALNLNAGPGWKPNIIAPIERFAQISVRPGVETLRKAIKDAAPGSTLHLKAGEYILEKSIKVSKDISITGEGSATFIRTEKSLEKLNYLFRVQEGATLSISNAILDGTNSNLKYAIVSPDKLKKNPYNLYVDNVTFQNFQNKNGGSVFKAYNGTKADILSFKNSRFIDNYRGLNLSYDKKLMGKFNANTIIIENSVFKNIEQHAINYFRKIPTSDIPGGSLIVANCIFSNVYNQKDGKIIRSDGIHQVEITNSVFENSSKIDDPVYLTGKNNVISNCLIYKSGKAKVSRGAKQVNLIYKKPRWKDELLFIPKSKSLLLRENNNVELIGIRQ